jgi:transcriptional regulator with XRE-family HTH domain
MAKKRAAMTLPKRLRQARGELSRRALSELIGYSPTMILKYEYGHIPKAIQYFEALTKARGTSPTWLLLGKGPEGLADALRPTPLDAELLAEVWEAVQRAHAEAGQTPHIRDLAATAAEIYDDLITLPPNRRPARLKAAVAALKAEAGGGA